MLRYHSVANYFFVCITAVLYLGTTLTNQNSIAEEMQIEVRKCLLSFGAEPFVFQVAIQNCEDQDI